MKAEEILTKYVKGDVCRDYSKKDKKYYTVTVETALKAIEEALNFYSKTKQMKAKDITIKALEYKNRRFQSQLKERETEKELLINHIISMGNGYNRVDVLELLTSKTKDES